MKKVLALILSAAVLAGALAGCGGKKSTSGDSLEGAWRAQIDMTDAVNQKVAASDIAGFVTISDFTVNLGLEFKDDGTYSVTVDQDALARSMEDVKGQLKDGTVAYLENMLKEQGIETSLEETFAAEGKSVDELMGQIDQWVSSYDLDETVDALKAEGRYKAEAGKLYLSNGTGEEPGSAYQSYTLSGDTLSLAQGSGGAPGAMGQFLPLTFTRA